MRIARSRLCANSVCQRACIEALNGPQDHIKKMNDEEKMTLNRLENKDYRTTKGYGYLKKKWRQYEQEMLDEKEILSWGGVRK